MIVTKIDTPFRKFLESLKVPSAPRMKGGTIFNPDEINYLARYSIPLVYEFVQENETDRDFYESLLNGYMKKCLFMGMLMFIWSFTYVMDNI